MQLCKYYPVANDRMGIIWTLSSIEGACVIEFGPAGTTHYAVEGVGSLNGNDKAKIYSTHMDQSDVTFGKYDRLEKAILEIDEKKQLENIIRNLGKFDTKNEINQLDVFLIEIDEKLKNDFDSLYDKTPVRILDRHMPKALW